MYTNVKLYPVLAILETQTNSSFAKATDLKTSVFFSKSYKNKAIKNV